MDLLRFLDLRIGRWLAYADSCLGDKADPARCVGFWTFVAVLLGLICVVVLATVAARVIIDRKKGAERGRARYRKPA